MLPDWYTFRPPITSVIDYSFADNELVYGSYILTEKDSNYNNYKMLKDKLTKKYGRPVEKYDVLTYKTNDTVVQVKHIIYPPEISITYYEKTFFEKQQSDNIKSIEEDL